MSVEDMRVELPRWRAARWLIETGCAVPDGVRREVVTTLFKSSAAFVAGEVNTALVACVIAARIPTWPFLLWALLQIAMAAARLRLQIGGAIALRRGVAVQPDAYLLVALIWAATIGYGTVISIASKDWLAATLACASAAAMVGAIAFRSFAAPRLVVAMIVLVLGPCSFAAVISGEKILLIAGIQLPLYLFSMGLSAFALNRMLLRTMQAERMNQHHARHDPLTGVSNRTGLAHWAEQVLDGRSGEVAVFYLDLDGFKAVNDRLGHAHGDLVLHDVAGRLRAIVGDEDAIARLGGDEFVIICRSGNGDSARHFGERIVRAIADEPFVMGDVAAAIGVSVGAALFPAHGRQLESLLLAADRALYIAKAAPKPCCIIAPIVPPVAATFVKHQPRFRTAA